MTFTQQMRIELVNVATLLPADVTFPRIRVRVTSFMQEVQSLVRKSDTAKYALKTRERPLAHGAPQRRVRRLFGAGGCDGSVGGGGGVAGRGLRIGVGTRRRPPSR